MRPTGWADALAQLDAILGEDGEMWLRAAVRHGFQAESLHDLDATARALAFQRTCLVLGDLEAEGLPLDLIDPDGVRRALLWRDGTISPPEGPTRNERVAAIFRKHFTS